MDSQFSLELPNASTSRDELGALRRGQAALKSAIDAVLPAPAVHRLVADTQVASDVLDAAAGRDKVQHPLTKLRGVTASSHAVLPCLGGAAAWRIPIIRLQEIQGALYDPAGHTTLATDNTNRPYTTPNFVFTYYLDGSLRSSQDATYSLAALYSYDGSGNRVGRAEPVNGSSGRALTTYTYNDAGKMVSMTSVATNTLATTLSYDLDGNLTQENDPNQGVTSLRYNHDSTLYSSTLTNSPYTLASWIYAYDGDYRITSQTFSGLGVGGVTPVQGTASYAYDGAGRISYLTLPGQSGQTVSWDHDGNRLTYQGVTYAYNMDDSIASAGGTSFTYFPTGTRRTDAAHFYCFDGYDRLFRATALTDVGCNSPTISYAYEGLDRQRAHSEGSGTTFMEYDGLSSTISAEYLGGGPSGAGAPLWAAMHRVGCSPRASTTWPTTGWATSAPRSPLGAPWPAPPGPTPGECPCRRSVPRIPATPAAPSTPASTRAPAATRSPATTSSGSEPTIRTPAASWSLTPTWARSRAPRAALLATR